MDIRVQKRSDESVRERSQRTRVEAPVDESKAEETRSGLTEASGEDSISEVPARKHRIVIPFFSVRLSRSKVS